MSRINNWASRVGLVAALGLAVFGFVMVAPQLESADHKDGPRVSGDPKADINDVYAFRSTENSANVVFALTVNPLTPPAQNLSAMFDESVSYNFHIDQNGDLTPDITAAFTFDGDTFTVTGLGAQPITGDVTPLSTTEAVTPVVNTEGPIRIFAGLRDDPFIMDLVGIQGFIANPVTPVNGVRPAGETPTDTFGGTNVSMILVELPITVATGGTNANSGTINAWGSTSRGGVQIDRMAVPGLNVLVVPDAQKDAFNSAVPANSQAQFGSTITQAIQGLRDAVMSVLPAENGGPLGNLSAAQVSAALSPDAVTIDFSSPVQFPNGRRLQDDVVNAALGVVLNRGGATGISDGVDTLDKPVTATFPYAASPHLLGATDAPGTFTPAPAFRVSLTVWNGGGYPLLDAAVGTGNSVWVMVDGKFHGYTVGAPAFVNANFISMLPAGIATRTAVVVSRPQ